MDNVSPALEKLKLYTSMEWIIVCNYTIEICKCLVYGQMSGD
jgi:hypothetical protein